MIKDIKLIVFDLDGTLVDAYQAITKSFNYTMRKIGYPKQSALVIRRAVGWGDRNLFKPFIEAGDIDKATIIYRQHHKTSLIKYARLFPRIEEVLGYLKSKGYKLAVASNRPTRFSLILVRYLKLNRYFDYILCADKLKHIKPHPEILHKIAKKFSLKPRELIYVGDMTIDAQAGRRAKVKTIIVTGGSSSFAQIKAEKPFLVINRITKLLKIF